MLEPSYNAPKLRLLTTDIRKWPNPRLLLRSLPNTPAGDKSLALPLPPSIRPRIFHIRCHRAISFLGICREAPIAYIRFKRNHQSTVVQDTKRETKRKKEIADYTRFCIH